MAKSTFCSIQNPRAAQPQDLSVEQKDSLKGARQQDSFIIFFVSAKKVGFAAPQDRKERRGHLHT
jgi:hypothetical protein